MVIFAAFFGAVISFALIGFLFTWVFRRGAQWTWVRFFGLAAFVAVWLMILLLAPSEALLRQIPWLLIVFVSVFAIFTLPHLVPRKVRRGAVLSDRKSDQPVLAISHAMDASLWLVIGTLALIAHAPFA